MRPGSQPAMPALQTSELQGAPVTKKPMQPAEPRLHSNLPIVEVAEGWQLDALLADAGAARFLLVRLDDRVAIVAPGQLDALLARLRKLGHTPKVLSE